VYYHENLDEIVYRFSEACLNMKQMDAI